MGRRWAALHIAVAAGAHLVEFGLLGARAGLDITEAITIGQLCKGHAQVLIETRKALDSVIATIVSKAAAQSMQGKMVDDLCENDLARIDEAPPVKWAENAQPDGSGSSR